MILTKRRAIKNHREMWNWIADETERQQRKVSEEEYFETFGIESVQLNCYCCEYDNAWRKTLHLTCQHCPLVWGKNKSGCCKLHDEQGKRIGIGLYEKWSISTDWRDSAELAREIANLPERN